MKKVLRYTVGELQTNCYLLIASEEGDAALIDPGEEAEMLLSHIRQEGVVLRRILLTHGHYDHVTAVPELVRVYPEIPVSIHEADVDGAGLTSFPLRHRVEKLIFCKDGDILPLGGGNLHVMHTPGHTKGSVVYQMEDLLFTGDTLFAGSCGRVDLPGGNETEMMDSLARLGKLQGDFTIYPGHMQSSTMEKERRDNPYLRLAMER